MALSVAIRRGGATIYTFSTNPFVEPENDYEFTTTEPAAMVSNTKTWTLEGRIYGVSTTDALANYSALVAVLENTAALPDGVQILNGATPIEQIGAEGGYLGFGIRSLKVIRTDDEWRGGVQFTMKVQATKRFAAAGGSTISDLQQTETYSYDEAGLLTHTLTGSVTVTSGPASTMAQTLGLTLPSPAFGFSTNGPGGVDVQVLDRAGLTASFTSTVVQNGETLPVGVGPSYTKSLTVERRTLDTHTVIVARGVGVGAAAAVAAERPSACTGETIVTNPKTLEATATFVQDKYAFGSLTKSRILTTSGGGQPVVYRARGGGRLPVKTKLARTAVELVETITVQVIGSPAADDFKVPDPLASLDEDPSALSYNPMPTIVSYGPTAAGNVWAMGLRRVYRGAQLSTMFPPAMLSLIAGANAPSSSKPSKENARKDK